MNTLFLGNFPLDMTTTTTETTTTSTTTTTEITTTTLGKISLLKVKFIQLWLL
jgi:hypothetical protein